MGLGENGWVDSGPLEALKGYVSSLLQQQSQAEPELEKYERRGFDQLRACLPGLNKVH